MDDKKTQKTIDIILQNQAQFYADLQKVQETNKRIQETNIQIQEAQIKAEKRTNVLERACLNLYNSSVEQGENIDKLTSDIRLLRDGQKETDERLNAVIFMAEKYFGEKNGGQKPKRKK
ncbi:MAG: hypothetical protein ACRD6X_04930 [Pyrinomonadaceae bacterium]